ncbi:solute carrier family 23 protein [Spirochaeta lutea]|uniref:solute carrier family 23 protein n=1 Tax=Spirochaeta lutea TaxID=1480694 RepID=UPI0009E099DF|nr:solute carrier family 23 protein [Spirochaeta lutea]
MHHQPIGIHERPPLAKWIPLSIQHVFAMFSATVLVPLLTGFSPSVALFTSGLGTLLYIAVTGGQVPAYLGSSFAFIAPLISVGTSPAYGPEYALGAAFVVGIFYALVAGLIRLFGKSWLSRLLPPVVIGSVIIVIGLSLSPVAMGQVFYLDGEFSMPAVLIALVTLGIAIISSIFLKGFFTVIPILLGIVGGYLFTLIMGSVNPAFALIDFSAVQEGGWISLPSIMGLKFDIIPISVFLIVSLATISEHLGDTLVIGRVIGKDIYEKPGLHRTLLGDGLATSVAALFGGPPNTTYGENIGVMAISRVYSVWVVGGAAVIALVLSFFHKFGLLIQTIPSPVMGGITMMLFGIIASAGIRTLVESGVDYSHKRNLIVSSVILVIGIGGGALKFATGEGLEFELSGVALATLVGIVLNLLLPDIDKEVLEEQKEIEAERLAQQAKEAAKIETAYVDQD